MNFVILVFGIPASGKSYFCKQLLSQNGSIHLLEADDFQKSHSFDQEDWKLSRQLFLAEFHKKIETLQNSIIVLSDDFLLRSQRKQILHICQQYKAAFIEVFMGTGLQDALKQNQMRERQLNEQVIRNAFDKLEVEPLGKFYIKAYKGLEKEILDKFIAESAVYYNDYYQEQEKLKLDQLTQQEQNKKNEIHQLDEKLRKIISSLMKRKENKLDGKLASQVKSLMLGKTKVENGEIKNLMGNMKEEQLEEQFLQLYDLLQMQSLNI